MKLVVVSDSHGDHERLDIPDGDVFIHCGDFSMQGRIADLLNFNSWLGKLPHKHKIVVAGNHDFICEKNYHLAKGSFTNANYLENEEMVIDGVTFWGSPYAPEFHNWAFMKERGDDIARIWKKIPSYVNVLITHGPPMGILDVNTRHEHCGCWDLDHKIRKIKPKVHVFGHIHEAYGSYKHKDGVRHFNCCVVNEYYDVVNKPTEIEL